MAPAAALGAAALAIAAAAAAGGGCGGGGGEPGGTVSVMVALPGANPAEVEQALVRPLEQALAGVPGRHGVRAVARDGHAVLELRVLRGVDAATAVDRARAAVDAVRAQLPADADVPHLVAAPGDWVLARLSDEAWSRSTTTAAGLGRAARQVERELLRLPVQRVEACGARDPRLAVDLVPVRLAAHGLTVADVARALTAAPDLPSGRVTEDDLVVRTHGRRGGYDEVADTVIGAGGVRVRDVAVVSERAQARCVVAGQPGEVVVRLGLRPGAARAELERAVTRRGLTVVAGAAVVVGRHGSATEVVVVEGVAPEVVEATLVGEDVDALAAAGRVAVAALAGDAAVVRAWCVGCATTELQRLELDRARMAQLGVDAAQVAQAMAVAVGGELVATLDDGERELGVVLSVEEGTTRWRELAVRTAGGALQPLDGLVRVGTGAELAERLHLDGQRAVAAGGSTRSARSAVMAGGTGTALNTLRSTTAQTTVPAAEAVRSRSGSAARHTR